MNFSRKKIISPVITQYDKTLFRIVHNFRQPKPGQNWNKFFRETKNMMIVFIAEETSLKVTEIGAIFGMKSTNNHLVADARNEIDPETYKEFRLIIADLMQMHRASWLSESKLMSKDNDTIKKNQ